VKCAASVCCRLVSVPPTALVSAKVNAVGASLKVNVTVPVVCAWLMNVLSIDTETVGVTVSTVKAAVLSPAPALPATF
jgi:hypothetical protein